MRISPERRQTIGSPPAWRRLRNRMAHEYLQETAPFAEAVAQALQTAPKPMNLARHQAPKAQAPV